MEIFKAKNHMLLYFRAALLFCTTPLLLFAQNNSTAVFPQQLDLLYTDSTGMKVAWMNPSESKSIYRLQKFELGIALPERINQEIRSFVYNLRLAPGSKRLNPFLEWELDVGAIFTHENGTSKTIDGFYYEDFKYKKNDWELNPSPYTMRVRFAPPLSGTWTCQVSVKVRGKQVVHTSPFTFQTIASSAPGYVSVHANNRNFERGGKMIFPIGHNFAAPEDSVRMYHNMEPGLAPHELNKATNASTWERYRQFISDFADSGGGFIRTIQTPWASLVEFEQKGNYFHRMHYAWEQDKLLELCEQKDVLILYNLFIQEPFMNFGDYWFYDWDWDSYDYDEKHHPESPYPVYGYNDNPGKKQPHEMFLLDEDMRYHEQRTRYYIARYGYSTAIYGFELLSEPYHLDQYWKNGPNNEPFLHKDHPLHDTVVKAIANYHSRISDYIKNTLNHREHLIAVNVTNASWLPYEGGIYDLSILSPNIDFVGINPYARFPNRFLISKTQRRGHLEIDEGENSYAALIHDYWNLCNKPIMISEGGQDEAVLGCSDYTGSAVDNKTLGFLGFAGYNLWTGFRKHEFFVWENTVRSHLFFSESVIPILENGSGNWKQGRQEEKLNRKDKEAIKELQYYVSEDQRLSAGYVYNRSYNFFTTRISDECSEAHFTEPESDGLPSMYPLETPQTVVWNQGPRKFRLTVEGLLKKQEYTIQWYSFSDAQVVHTATVRSNRKGMFVLQYPDLTVTGNEPNPVVWYTLKAID